MRQIALIAGCTVYEEDDGRVHYLAKAAIDGDGGNNEQWGDPDYQEDTSLHHDDKPINADEVPYVVVPPAIIFGVIPIVLGCRAQVTDTRRGKTVMAVVADIGPHKKIGEISIRCAFLLGIPHSPLTGGVDAHVILYELWPGVPAVVDGIEYGLSVSHG